MLADYLSGIDFREIENVLIGLIFLVFTLAGRGRGHHRGDSSDSWLHWPGSGSDSYDDGGWYDDNYGDSGSSDCGGSDSSDGGSDNSD